jgi:hypothetical protein
MNEYMVHTSDGEVHFVETEEEYVALLDKYGAEVVYSCKPQFSIYTHGHNGDFPFSELWGMKETLEEAKDLAEEIMLTKRFDDLHNGTPTIHWVEIFGPGIEESIGCELIGGNLKFCGA